MSAGGDLPPIMCVTKVSSAERALASASSGLGPLGL